MSSWECFNKVLSIVAGRRGGQLQGSFLSAPHPMGLLFPLPVSRNHGMFRGPRGYPSVWRLHLIRTNSLLSVVEVAGARTVLDWMKMHIISWAGEASSRCLDGFVCQVLCDWNDWESETFLSWLTMIVGILVYIYRYLVPREVAQFFLICRWLVGLRVGINMAPKVSVGLLHRLALRESIRCSCK